MISIPRVKEGLRTYSQNVILIVCSGAMVIDLQNRIFTSVKAQDRRLFQMQFFQGTPVAGVIERDKIIFSSN